ncbi:MAG: DUF3990 domain-containing protein [Firmicutes bacterium]|nr:DUF3990 domain-containing protein [Candidatus Fiminaster equi]
MILFHGSNAIIETPVQYGSSKDNDYGPSFYVTVNNFSGKIWACKNEQVGYVNKYFIRNDLFNDLTMLDLTNKDKFSVLTWLAILMHFRKLDERFKKLYENRIKWLEKYYIEVTDYDVIKGFRADDSYFKFPLCFINGTLSYEKLCKVYKLGNLGIQYAIMSKKAISGLKFLDAKECDESFVGKYKDIVTDATRQFNEILNEPINDNETFIMDLMKNDDK